MTQYFSKSINNNDCVYIHTYPSTVKVSFSCGKTVVLIDPAVQGSATVIGNRVCGCVSVCMYVMCACTVQCSTYVLYMCVCLYYRQL